jgi:hypothetical protein
MERIESRRSCAAPHFSIQTKGVCRPGIQAHLLRKYTGEYLDLTPTCYLLLPSNPKFSLAVFSIA